MSPEAFEPWFRLLETPGVGRDTARRLLAACGSPEAVFQTSAQTLRQLVGTAVAAALGKQPPAFAQRLHAAQEWLAGGPDRQVLTLGDPLYPAQLLHTADPPLLLYLQGQAQALSQRSLAIVGSRNATAQGLDSARAFARELAGQGWVVVSGLAQGIDGAAHDGALAAAEPGVAVTIAVVGTGLDLVYPPRHQRLARRIQANGLLVSELAPGTPALPQHFPQRNRIIASLTLGTLVVEAALKSGSLITARLASEAGREVFAVPGSIHAPQSRGCHALIKQGAKLVESAQDILEEFAPTLFNQTDLQSGFELRPPASEGGTEIETSAEQEAGIAAQDRPLLQALGHDPVTTDALQARTGWPTADLLARLLELELAGHVARLPGGLYQRRQAS